MREFTRIVLKLLLIGFLVVGCVHNVWYLGELTKNANNSYHRYNGYNYNSNRTNYIDAEEIEEVPENITPTQEDEYPDYNRPMTSY